MLSDLRAAELCQAAYSESPLIEAGDCHVLLATVAGITVAAFRGSASLEDWVSDIEMIGHEAAEHDVVGTVHAAFLADAVAMLPHLLAIPNLLLLGHSKGGGEAILAAALMVYAGVIPSGIVTFGAPKVAGFNNTKLAGLLSGIPGKHYRHRDDPVPLLPVGFYHPYIVTQLVAPQFEMNCLADHSISSGYIPALSAAGL